MSDLLDLLAEMEAPRRDCGHLIPMDNYAHAEECLNLTCPHCGTTVRNAYALVIEHGAFDENHIERYGTCWPQRWMFGALTLDRGHGVGSVMPLPRG
jgi:hypothetical protein